MISIIVPTYNAAGHLDALVSSLRAQTEQDVEILIIDSASEDPTVEIARSCGCRVLTVEKADFDHGTTRNLAAAGTSGEFIVFLTQDALPADEHLLAELITPLRADPTIAVCYGRQLPRPDAGVLECFARNFNYPDRSVLKSRKDIETLGLKTFFCSNSCAAYRRSVFETLGGFKNNVIANEDMLFAANAIARGYSVYYAAAARVYHSHADSLGRRFQRYFNIGQFFADNREVFGKIGLGGYGAAMIRAGAATFKRQKVSFYTVLLIIDCALKAVACKTGWYYQRFQRVRRGTPRR
jgi:rhamnosyltransferase